MSDRDGYASARQLLHASHYTFDIRRQRDELDTLLVQPFCAIHLLESAYRRRSGGSHEQSLRMRSAAVWMKKGAFGMVTEDVGVIGL